MVKWPITPKIDYGPISRLYPQLTPNLLQLTERIRGVKDKENKRAERKERKRARKKNRKETTKEKNPKFGLCACAKLKKCTFLHLISGKSTFKVGNHFFVKTNANLESLQPKN